MAHAEDTITIDRPVKEVFDFILDGTNSPRWRSSVVDVKLLPGKPLGVGAVFKQGLKIKFQVIAGPARPTGTYIFKSMDGSTRVTFILDFQPKGLAKLMDGMINKSMKEEVATLSNLKAYLESHD